MTPLIASIDVGSNTVRMLAARVINGRIQDVALDARETTRLAEGLHEGGRLSRAARERTLKVMVEYAARLKAAKIDRVDAVATAAMRTASDSASFISAVYEKTGILIRVLTGEQEARSTLYGIKAGVGDTAGDGPKLLVDIGGGSTELVYTTDWKDHRALSLPLGAVTLYERLIKNDPPKSSEVAMVEAECYRGLSGLDSLVPPGLELTLIGTAGTVCTLAAVDLGMDEYDGRKVTGHMMTRETVDRLLSRFAGLTKESRMLLAGMEPGREDIILSGTALLGAVMDRADAGSVLVSDYGLREGNLLYLSENKGG